MMPASPAIKPASVSGSASTSSNRISVGPARGASPAESAPSRSCTLNLQLLPVWICIAVLPSLLPAVQIMSTWQYACGAYLVIRTACVTNLSPYIQENYSIKLSRGYPGRFICKGGLENYDLCMSQSKGLGRFPNRPMQGSSCAHISRVHLQYLQSQLLLWPMSCSSSRLRLVNSTRMPKRCSSLSRRAIVHWDTLQLKVAEMLCTTKDSVMAEQLPVQQHTRQQSFRYQ